MQARTSARWRWMAAFALLLSGHAHADPVRIAFPADSVDFAPAYVAERLGLFKQRQLDVKLIIFRGGAAVQEAMNAGAADLICYFGPAVALAVSKGAKEKFVMTVLAGAVGWNLHRQGGLARDDRQGARRQEGRHQHQGVDLGHGGAVDRGARRHLDPADPARRRARSRTALRPGRRHRVLGADDAARDPGRPGPLARRYRQGHAADLGQRLRRGTGDDGEAAGGAARHTGGDPRGGRLHEGEPRLDARLPQGVRQVRQRGAQCGALQAGGRADLR